MVIIDGHVHLLEYLGGACGWESPSKHLVAFQEHILGHDHNKSEIVNFRIGKFGRYEWTKNGVDYYRQYMPPTLQEQVAPPEFMLAQMDHAGVDMAVLQNTKVYGKYNEYFSECVKKYPDKFVGTAEIDELEADKKSEITKLRHAIKNLGLKGLFYEALRFIEIGNPDGFNSKKFDPFWREVSDLGIPVHWILRTHHMEQMRAFSNWAERYPDITSVVVHGLEVGPFIQNGEVKIPRELLDIFRKHNVFQEILYPIRAGTLGWDYPFLQARPLIKQQYEEFGPHKLIWGTDMPNVERNCTYKQSLNYLKDYCDFIKPGDMELILGGNIARILKIQIEHPKTVRPKLDRIA